MAENKALNRIKVVLAEKGKSNKWLAEELGKGQATISNGVQMPHNQIWKIL